MESIEATPERGTAASARQTPVTPRSWWTLRAVVIRLLEACLRRVRPSCAGPVVALLPAPTAWSAEAVQGEHDSVRLPARSAWQWLGVIVVLVLACAAAWGAWRRIETLERRHEEAVRMMLAALEQELADQRASLETIRIQVKGLTAQVTAASTTTMVDVPLELRALKQHVEEVEMTIGAYGAILGKQQHELATHTEQLSTHDAALRSLAAARRPTPTTTSTKARTRSATTTPPVSATEADVAATRESRPLITLPANLGAWSLGMRTPDR